MRTGQWTRVPRATINIGERIRIPTGEAVAFDCEVLRGESLIDEAVFTGEALPRRVQPGDALFAGTVNRDASIEAEVNSSYRDSRLAALQERIATARRGKPKYLRLIDRWAAQFVSFVIIAAALTALGWATIDPERSLWTALAVLVVACPCALSLATPATLASATAWLQQRNIWVHGEYGLLAAPNVDLLLIDKTGTLTDTNLTLAQVHTSPRLSKTEALSVAAAIQQFSQHPAAKPFHQHPAAAGVDAVEAVPGRGMVAQWRGRQLRLGSYEYCAELGSIPATPDDSHYWVALADSEGWLAWFGLGEALRPDAVALMDAVRQRGIDVKIVSGDRNTRVAAIAEQLGVEFQGGATPADKLAIIRDAQSKKRTVLAVGDGLNDAPFLGAADVSIAVANATALTRVEADFAIDEARLDRIITILEISDQNRRVTRQNLLWAASYNLLGIPLAAVGWVPPWLAAIGMSLSSLLVVLNALRLRRYRERSP
jgi:Cu2+-exporting ATPase